METVLVTALVGIVLAACGMLFFALMSMLEELGMTESERDARSERQRHDLQLPTQPYREWAD